MKTITIEDIDWRILTDMKYDRNFKSIAQLISSLVREEAISPGLVKEVNKKEEAENGIES